MNDLYDIINKQKDEIDNLKRFLEFSERCRSNQERTIENLQNEAAHQFQNQIAELNEVIQNQAKTISDYEKKDGQKVETSGYDVPKEGFLEEAFRLGLEAGADHLDACVDRYVAVFQSLFTKDTDPMVRYLMTDYAMAMYQIANQIRKLEYEDND